MLLLAPDTVLTLVLVPLADFDLVEDGVGVPRKVVLFVKQRRRQHDGPGELWLATAEIAGDHDAVPETIIVWHDLALHDVIAVRFGHLRPLCSDRKTIERLPNVADAEPFRFSFTIGLDLLAFGISGAGLGAEGLFVLLLPETSLLPQLVSIHDGGLAEVGDERRIVDRREEGRPSAEKRSDLLRDLTGRELLRWCVGRGGLSLRAWQQLACTREYMRCRREEGVQPWVLFCRCSVT